MAPALTRWVPRLVIHTTAHLTTKTPDQTFKSGDLRPRHWSGRGARESAQRSVSQRLVPQQRMRALALLQLATCEGCAFVDLQKHEVEGGGAPTPPTSAHFRRRLKQLPPP